MTYATAYDELINRAHELAIATETTPLARQYALETVARLMTTRAAMSPTIARMEAPEWIMKSRNAT